MKVILLTLLLFIVVIVVMLLVSMQVYRKYEKINKKKYPSKEQKWPGTDKNALILYQPSQHNTVEKMVDAVGNYLAGEEKYTVIKNHVTCTEEYDLEKMDLLIFMTPIYMEKCSPNLVEYLERHSFRHKKVFLFATGIHTDVMQELEELETVIQKENNIYKLKIAKNEMDKVKSFIQKNL